MGAEIEAFVKYAKSKVGQPYCWGGNGQTVEELVRNFAQLNGQSKANTDKMVNFMYNNGFKDFSLQDCSGLVYNYLRSNNIVSSDMNAQMLYNKCKKTTEHHKGYLAFFQKKDGTINHVGIVVDETHVVHCLNVTVGCILEEISKRDWIFGVPEFAFDFNTDTEENDVITLKKGVFVYTTAYDAETNNNDSKHYTYKAGTYYVYKKFGNATNITKSIGVAGGWVSNEKLKGAM